MGEKGNLRQRERCEIDAIIVILIVRTMGLLRSTDKSRP